MTCKRCYVLRVRRDKLHAEFPTKYLRAISTQPALIVANYVVIIIGLIFFEMVILSHLVTMHQVPCASCGILYYLGLVSCYFYVIPF